MTDLYRKKTDRNQYLLTSSCPSTDTTNNIPFSLALRIVRLRSLPKDREERFKELRGLLLSRDYKSGVILQSKKQEILPDQKSEDKRLSETNICNSL